MQEAVDTVTAKLQELTDKYVPSSVPTLSRPLPWWDAKCERAWRWKKRAHFDGGCPHAIRKETKICNRVCRKAYGRHVLRLKIRLARASGSRDFWKLTKHLSGMSKRKRTATPSPQALADYFAA